MLINIFLSAGSDFVGIAGLQLIFGPSVSSRLVQVDIMDDNVLEELIENFTAILTSSVPRLALLPDVAMVDILDDDCKQRTNDDNNTIRVYSSL